MTRAQLLRRGLIVGGLLAFGELPESLTELTEPPAAESTLVGHWWGVQQQYLTWYGPSGLEHTWTLAEGGEREHAQRSILDAGGAYAYGGLAL